jgi:SAM-dependent methyltransferase
MERYTLGYDAAALAFVSRRTLESHGAFFIPHLQPGIQVLDVGCGPGSMTVGIAAHIGTGRVIGVDMSESQVRLAAQTAVEQGITNAEFRIGSAYGLPFADAQFDAVFSHALLEHLREPVRAMREFLRVLKPGGVMGVATPDWSGFLVGPLNRAVEVAIDAFKALQVGNGGDVDIGHKLSQYAVDAGFEGVTLRARYENFKPVTIITDLLTANLDRAGQPEHARTLRAWQSTPHAMFAEAWVACVGYKPESK